jgi:uncharacterized protein (TIGR02594 family)
MNPQPYGPETTGNTSAAIPASLTMAVPLVEPIEATNVRVAELNPKSKVANLKMKATRIEPLKTVNAQAVDVEPDRSAIASIDSADTRVAALEQSPSPAPQVAQADINPSKMEPALSPFQPIVYASLQPSKMSPGVVGLTGALRYADSPWLDHAINDVGTNPTGWKRVWCARSLNMWLQRSGKRGCGSDAAISCLEAGDRLPEPKVGAIAVLKHHVGIVTEINDRHVTLVSGNNRGRPGARTVGISKYARASIVGYVWPR